MAIINNLPYGGGGGAEELDLGVRESYKYSLPESAFKAYSEIVKAYFPSCSIIGSWAFFTCYSLTTVSFPICISIGNNAFQNCNRLTEASFPACTIIGTSAFVNCLSLTEASFPVCTSINSHAFWNCNSLTEAYFPACTYIGASAFQYVTGNLYLGAYSNSNIYTIFGKANASSASNSVSYTSYIQISGIEIPAMTSLGQFAFFYASKLQTIKAVNCTIISNYAFNRCTSLTTVSFPACTSISTSAFAYCTSLSEASFPACTIIGTYAFQTCYSLTTISFPACTSVGGSAFYGCKSLMSAYFLSTSVCTLGSSAFKSTPMSSSSYTGTFGSIYVPSSLVDSYKRATNWTAYSNRITAYTE